MGTKNEKRVSHAQSEKVFPLFCAEKNRVLEFPCRHIEHSFPLVNIRRKEREIESHSSDIPLKYED